MPVPFPLKYLVLDYFLTKAALYFSLVSLLIGLQINKNIIEEHNFVCNARIAHNDFSNLKLSNF